MLVLAVKYSEIVLKARHARSQMEGFLVANLRKALESDGATQAKLVKESGVIFVEVEDEEKQVPVLLRVFGVDAVLVSKRVELDEKKIFAECAALASSFKPGSSFAVRAKRASKQGRGSQELGALCGSAIFDAFPSKKLKVDLDEPENEVFVEVRRDCALVSGKSFRGPAGLPVGCEGKAVCVIKDSGKSLLAVWMMAKRGLLPVLLFSPSLSEEERSIATKKIAKWLPGIAFDVHTPKSRLSEKELIQAAAALAGEVGANCVVSGELLREIGDKIASIDEGVELPVFRPLIGFDEGMLKNYLGKTGFGGNETV